MSELPRVTDILAFAGLMPDYERWDPRRKGIEKGMAVDQGCRLLFQGHALDQLEVDERILPELTSLDLWLKQTGFYAIGIQHEVTSRYGFIGHPDVYDWTIVIDTKTGGKAKWHALQTAPYLVAINEGLLIERPSPQMTSRQLTKRAALYLQADGTIAKLDPHEDRSDWGVFLSALKIYQGEKALEPYRENIRRWLAG